MMIKSLLIYFSIFLTVQSVSSTRYHELNFTTSDPIITKRCISVENRNELAGGYVKETVNKDGRCIKLEFYETKGVYYKSVDFPSIIKYCWTDSSLIQTLYQSEGDLFSKEYMVRPKKKNIYLTA